MKDKELKFEETEGSHTLGRTGEVRVRGKWRDATRLSCENKDRKHGRVLVCVLLGYQMYDSQ